VSSLDVRTRNALPALALLAVTATWGSTFFLIKDLLHEVPVLDFLAVRFAIASVVLFLVAPRAVLRLSRDELRYGAILGCIYGIAQILQTWGLQHTSASISGFVTGMYVVATPLLAALLLREPVGRLAWTAVGVSTIGLAFLSLQGFSISSGVALTFASAVLYGGHIVGLGRWSTPANAYGLSVVQMGVITVVCSTATLGDGVTLPQTTGTWASLIYMAVVAGAMAILAQTWAQAHMAPTRAAIIMTMEPVFAAFFAVLLGGESLEARMLIGGSLVLTAMYLVELAPRRKIEAEVTHLTV
jgi:drug/metabolite transporter (DMT)-like permease